MDQNETFAFLDAMYGSVDGAYDRYNQALTRAALVDSDGRLPVDPDWVPTYDEWEAAAQVAELLHAHSLVTGQTGDQPLTSFTSEGATFNYGQARTWADVAAQLRAQSPNHTAGVGMLQVGRQGAAFMPRSERRAWWW